MAHVWREEGVWKRGMERQVVESEIWAGFLNIYETSLSRDHAEKFLTSLA